MNGHINPSITRHKVGTMDRLNAIVNYGNGTTSRAAARCIEKRLRRMELHAKGLSMSMCNLIVSKEWKQ